VTTPTELPNATRDVDRSSSSWPRRALDAFRDPLVTFVVLALSAGVFLACAIPWFAGIDEPAHFYRSYQMSTGTLVPDKLEGTEFGGACVPTSVVQDVLGYQGAYARHLVDLFGADRFNFSAAGAGGADDHTTTTPVCAAADESPVTFSTFGSPVPYLPQTAAVLVARAAGFSAGPMMLLGRFVMLAVYIGLVALAIRRTPRAKWAIAAVALLPVALFQSVGWSHDSITTAIALLVVSSALRALDPPDGVTARSLIVEALLLSALLGSCKPGYAMLSLLYLLPLLGPLRRRECWPLVFAPVASVATTALLSALLGTQWRTDADYFGIAPDPSAQREELTSAPWHFAADSVRTVWHETGTWLRGVWGVGPSNTHLPFVVILVGVVLYLFVSVQRERSEPIGLHWQQRLLVAVTFLVGFGFLLVASYVYWTTPGNDVITGVQARYFLPLLVLIPVAIGGVDRRWLRARDSVVPLAVALVPFVVLFCAAVAFRMR
jgi:hypothetical protein